MPLAHSFELADVLVNQAIRVVEPPARGLLGAAREERLGKPPEHEKRFDEIDRDRIVREIRDPSEARERAARDLRCSERMEMEAIDDICVRRYLTRMKTTVSTKGQIILPAEFRKRDGVEPGQEFEVERIDRGEYRLKRKARRRNEGLVQLLLACPVKGWFKPMDRRETTGDIDVPALG